MFQQVITMILHNIPIMALFLLLPDVICQHGDQPRQHHQGKVEVQGQENQIPRGYSTGGEPLHEEIPTIFEQQQVSSNNGKQNSIHIPESREDEIPVEMKETRHQEGDSRPKGNHPSHQRVLHKDIEHEKE